MEEYLFVGKRLRPLLILLFWMGFGTIPFSPSSYALTGDEQNNIDIYKKYSSGVVNITSIVITRDFFLNPVPQGGTGSGSLIDQEGHILTNAHVVSGASELHVTLADESQWPARVVGMDESHDLAVIQIDAPNDLYTVIPMGDSDSLQVGQKVLAIGNPFGLDRTLTTGIISSLKRSLRAMNGLLIDDVIQTDAAINPGNSGGPLLNSKGEMIGINSAIFSPSGGNVGIGFSVAVNVAKWVVPQLISQGYVSYPWLGITTGTVSPALAKALDLPVRRGAMVLEIAPNSPADEGGIHGSDNQIRVGNQIIPIGGDIITEIEGVKVESTDQLVQALLKNPPGKKIEITVYRKEKRMTLSVTLGERPRKR